MPNNFIPIRFTGDAELKLKAHLKSRILALEEGLHELHETKITKWRKAYEATPREKTREFPFYNASNLVVPIIAIFSDTLLARVMSALIKTKPNWVTKLYGTHRELGDDVREALEEFLDYVAVEPEELDLYRVYHEWFSDAIKYGTSLVKCPHELRYKYDLLEVAGDATGTQRKPQFIREIEYEGPRPEKIPFENFLVPAGAKTLQLADIIIHKRSFTRSELEERRFYQVYDPLKGRQDFRTPGSVLSFLCTTNEGGVRRCSDKRDLWL